MKKMIRAVLFAAMLSAGATSTAFAADYIVIGSNFVSNINVQNTVESESLIEAFDVNNVTVIDSEDENTSSISTLLMNEETTEVVVEESVAVEEVAVQEVVEEIEELQTEKVSSYVLGDSLGVFKLTSYCGCRKCNGKWTGYPTASGTDYEVGRTIAVDKRVIPLGTWVYLDIPGEGWQKFRAEDTGSAIKGHKIDVYIGDNHGDCYQSRYNGKVEVRLALN